ncbi:hypothetical protein GCWU000324_02790 [Kingella oralis ATCC 51147]|uniref:Uncharacterized protein n=1 Tax=Kingella oralis ATCC 51147 TaxID=629741 RepID=C4GM56_9NEIS|nr:hypothetical protein GCWU000324_02790 [Kingella oralis ATCC 51147]
MDETCCCKAYQPFKFHHVFRLPNVDNLKQHHTKITLFRLPETAANPSFLENFALLTFLYFYLLQLVVLNLIATHILF